MRAERTNLDVSSDLGSLMRAAAERVAGLAQASVAARGRFSIALSGGSTPRALYVLLAGEPFVSRIDWKKTEVFWGDERAVPRDATDSNYRMANDALLSHVAIPEKNVHRIVGEETPERAARLYEDDLVAFFGDARKSDAFISFDLVLLGMGPDGHIASIFPGTPPVDEVQRWVVPNESPFLPKMRITLTPPILARARNTIVLVAGAEKASRLAEVLDGPVDAHRLPAQLTLSGGGNVTWMVDRAATSALAPRD